MAQRSSEKDRVHLVGEAGGDDTPVAPAPECLTEDERADIGEAQRLVAAAREGAQRAATAVQEAHGAYRFVWGKLARRYGLAERDSLNTETGVITRAPAPTE